ncbi:MAG: DNA polymerase, partial [Eubacteriaceae bacterium]|nr:DNA polymerase [Eubacteriaceae bacterium]
MDNRIVIIDGNSLMNRAYYAMQKPMITKDGLYTQGVYGFLNMLNKIENDYEPDHIAVCFDLKAPTFRHKEYAEYKAGRKKMPPELAMELPVIKDVLTAMNIKIVEMEGFEADDLIGTIAREAEEHGLSPLIITGDKDEFQLATDTTQVIFTKRGVSQFELYDRARMIEEYGFTPTQFIDYKGLMGDVSDNIPGVPGVGPKTAGRLIVEYGSVEGVLENIDKLKKGKMRDNIEENAQQALMSKRLATINVNVPIEIDFAEYKKEEPDMKALTEIYRKLEFNSFLRKLGSRAGVKAAAAASKKVVEEADTHMVTDADGLAEFLGRLAAGAEITLKIFGDADHRDSPVLTGASVLCGREYYYIDFGGKRAAEPGLHRTLAAAVTQKELRVTGHDLIYDYYMLMCCGAERIITAFDTSVAKYVLDSGRSNYSLTVLAEEYFGEAIETQKDFLEAGGQIDMFTDMRPKFSSYGLRWCLLVTRLAEAEKAEIENEDLGTVLYDVEFPLAEVMAYMEYIGFTVDRGTLKEIGGAIGGTIDDLTADIYELAGEEFNINSTKQLGPILFEKLGIPAGKKTKTGYSTNAETLEKRADDHPIIPKILEYRTLTKLKGTYIDGLIPLIARDGKIHAHFNQTVAATGRISSSDPNLQN